MTSQTETAGPRCGYVLEPKDVTESMRKKVPVVSSWSDVMDHLVKYHGVAKDDHHALVCSETVKAARSVIRQRTREASLSESRFQDIWTTRYIIKNL